MSAGSARSNEPGRPTGLWLKLHANVVENGVWGDFLDQRLWIWLLCMAKQPAAGLVQGEVRFVYSAVIQAMSGRLLGRKVTVTRKALKASLRRLAADGRIHVREWQHGPARARAQGGAQGYIVVTLCNFKTYQGRGATGGPGWDQGRDQGGGTRLGPGGDEAAEALSGAAATNAHPARDQARDQGADANGDQLDIKKREEREEKAPATPSLTTSLITKAGKKAKAADPARALSVLLHQRTGQPRSWCLSAVQTVLSAGYPIEQVEPFVAGLDGVSSQGLRALRWQDDTLLALRAREATPGRVGGAAPTAVARDDNGLEIA